MLESPPLQHYFSSDHEQFRAALREFVACEITPFVNSWDEAGSFPRSLYQSAAELGALGVGFPEAYGGTPADVFFKIVLAEEFARCGSGGIVATRHAPWFTSWRIASSTGWPNRSNLWRASRWRK
jgi:acyl-CoA dehydrogenase